jgi:predicted nucleotidyltransferase
VRITEAERRVLIAAIRTVDAEAKIWLFGSRVDDTKKGGDIDIAILSGAIKLRERMKIRQSIEDVLGEQKIDILVSEDGAAPFFRLAVETGIRIDE